MWKKYFWFLAILSLIISVKTVYNETSGAVGHQPYKENDFKKTPYFTKSGLNPRHSVKNPNVSSVGHLTQSPRKFDLPRSPSRGNNPAEISFVYPKMKGPIEVNENSELLSGNVNSEKRFQTDGRPSFHFGPSYHRYFDHYGRFPKQNRPMPPFSPINQRPLESWTPLQHPPHSDLGGRWQWYHPHGQPFNQNVWPAGTQNWGHPRPFPDIVRHPPRYRTHRPNQKLPSGPMQRSGQYNLKPKTVQSVQFPVQAPTKAPLTMTVQMLSSVPTLFTRNLSLAYPETSENKPSLQPVGNTSSTLSIHTITPQTQQEMDSLNISTATYGEIIRLTSEPLLHWAAENETTSSTNYSESIDWNNSSQSTSAKEVILSGRNAKPTYVNSSESFENATTVILVDDLNNSTLSHDELILRTFSEYFGKTYLILITTCIISIIIGNCVLLYFFIWKKTVKQRNLRHASNLELY